MAERPLLSLPKPRHNDRVQGSSAGFDPNADVVRPSTSRQEQRLAPQFDRLRQVLGHSSVQATMELRADPDGIAPERALVFEVAGSLGDFYRQVRRIMGLEFLLDEEFEFEPDDDFHHVQRRGDSTVRSDEAVGGRLYIAMPDIRALKEILGLWDRHRLGLPIQRGFAPWSKLFELLRAVRPWGPQDRVLPETLDYWRERLKSNPASPVRFELELWFYEQEPRRQQALLEVTRQVRELGGSVVCSVPIADIRYHGMLIELSPERIQDLLANPTVTLARLDEIMYLRPQSVASFPLDAKGDLEEIEGDGEDAKVKLNKIEPVAAMLDGIPLENHVCLRGRLIVDDPDELASLAPVATRGHGTGMASLILHGDLQAGETSLKRPLVVRPVMVYNAAADEETTPPDRLPLDVIYQAVRRMQEGDAHSPAFAPSVVVINLSLGEFHRPYAGRISPWARLIDWLSFHYRVLFLVSAGNVKRELPVRAYATSEAFRRADSDERTDEILKALDTQKGARSLLSPAEGLNALTVGACHVGVANESAAFNLVDPFPSEGFPNVSSALGLGHRRSIKPDLLYDGGREFVSVLEDEGHVWLRARSGGGIGQLVAAPDYGGTGRLNVKQRMVGSSNATALLTRSAVRIYDSLVEAGMSPPRLHSAVLLKALLMHGAEWGESGRHLENLFGSSGSYSQRRDNIARFLGYGRPNVERVLDCTAERATLFGYGDLTCNTEDAYDIPLPPSLEGSTEVRRLTVTLAWLSPVNFRHQNYRAATLEVEPRPTGTSSYKDELAVARSIYQPTHHAVGRGTVDHCIYEGENAIAFLDGGFLRFSVTCRAQAGDLEEAVPYALAISVETGVGSGIAVYDEMRAAIQPAVRATVVS